MPFRGSRPDLGGTPTPQIQTSEVPRPLRSGGLGGPEMGSEVLIAPYWIPFGAGDGHFITRYVKGIIHVKGATAVMPYY